MVCRLCDKDKTLVKSHIIPRSFFRRLRSGPKALEIHTNTKGKFPKRSQMGIYDKSILCGECDRRFGPWEDHAQDVLLRQFSEDLAISHRNKKAGYKINEFKYKNLKLFFLGLLWKASITKETFFQKISTGPYENTLKNMILEDDPGGPDKFSVTLGKFSDPRITAMLDPHFERIEGVNYSRFYLTGFVAYIKVDRRPPPPFLKDFVITEGSPIIVLLRDLSRSKEVPLMRDILLKN